MLIGDLDPLRLFKQLIGLYYQLPDTLVVRIAAKKALETVYGSCGIALTDLRGEHLKHEVRFIGEKLLDTSTNF